MRSERNAFPLKKPFVRYFYIHQRAALFPPRANKNVPFLSLSEYHTKHGFSARNDHFEFIREEEATTTTRERNEPYTQNTFPIQNEKFDQIPRVRSLDRERLLTER